MGNLNLKPSAQKILLKVAPIWMDKLQKVCWNKFKLRKKDYLNLTGVASACFMGEIHCWNGAYAGCNKCAEFCRDIPTLMTDYVSDRFKKTLLERVANHIQTRHPSFLRKKK